MNPFDWSGPSFLVFYLGVCAVALALARLLRTRQRRGAAEQLDDPCELAYLRGGPDLAARVALFALLDRRILKADQGALRRVPNAAGAAVQRPVEQAIFAATGRRTPVTAAEVVFDPDVRRAAERVGEELSRRGLALTCEEHQQRKRPRALLAWFVVALAGIKILVALSRGRTNVLFLVAACVGCVWLLAKVGAPPWTTRRGERTLALARARYEGLRRHIEDDVPGPAAEPDAALYAGLFGFTGLPRSSWLAEGAGGDLAWDPDLGSSSSDSGGHESGGGRSGCGGCGS